MTKTGKSLILWVFAVAVTLGLSYYQRVTGPTYPVRGHAVIGGQKAEFKLERSHETNENQEVVVSAPEPVEGFVIFKRFKSLDTLSTLAMTRSGGELKAELPAQPPAGKIEYQVFLKAGAEEKSLTPNPIITRFKGVVPTLVLILHVVVIFSSMLFSVRAGAEALASGNRVYFYTLWTVITLVVGGFILGPIVQKYAFGAYWTGWPFGTDLTDNKTLFALIFWIVAFWRVRKNPASKAWVVIASIALLAIFLIPHSLLGSELDHTKAVNP